MTEEMTPERWRSASEYERCAWLEENAARIFVRAYDDAAARWRSMALSEMTPSTRARQVIGLSERDHAPVMISEDDADSLGTSDLAARLEDAGEYKRCLGLLTNHEERAVHALSRVVSMKETLLTAFLAETGCKPSECEIVEVREATTVLWFVRKRHEDRALADLYRLLDRRTIERDRARAMLLKVIATHVEELDADECAEVGEALKDVGE